MGDVVDDAVGAAAASWDCLSMAGGAPASEVVSMLKERNRGQHEVLAYSDPD